MCIFNARSVLALTIENGRIITGQAELQPPRPTIPEADWLQSLHWWI